MSWSFKNLSDKMLRNFQSDICTKNWENQWDFESGPEPGGLASVRDPVMNRQDCTKTDHKNPLLSLCLLQISDSFHLEAAVKFSSVQFQAGSKVHVYLIHSRLFCYSALFFNANSLTQFILCAKLYFG